MLNAIFFFSLGKIFLSACVWRLEYVKNTCKTFFFNLESLTLGDIVTARTPNLRMCSSSIESLQHVRVRIVAYLQISVISVPRVGTPRKKKRKRKQKSIPTPTRIQQFSCRKHNSSRRDISFGGRKFPESICKTADKNDLGVHVDVRAWRAGSADEHQAPVLTDETARMTNWCRRRRIYDRHPGPAGSSDYLHVPHENGKHPRRTPSPYLLLRIKYIQSCLFCIKFTAYGLLIAVSRSLSRRDSPRVSQ